MARTNYVWDEVNDTLLIEQDEAGNTTAAYTYEPGQYGPLISQRRGGQTSYYHFDGQGSTRQLTDAAGNVTDTSTYAAFGEPVASTGTTTNPFGYKGALGYHANPETNDLYVRESAYQPTLARWLSMAPLTGGPGPAGACTAKKCIEACGGYIPLGGIINAYTYYCMQRCLEAYKKFKEWYLKEKDLGVKRFSGLPSCPCTLPTCERMACALTGTMGGGITYNYPVREFCAPKGWWMVPPASYWLYLQKYHPGASFDIRSPGCPSQQCTYDSTGGLMTHGPGVGTVDTFHCGLVTHGEHIDYDVQEADWAMLLDGGSATWPWGGWPDPNGACFKLYLQVRPPNNGLKCRRNP